MRRQSWRYVVFGALLFGLCLFRGRGALAAQSSAPRRETISLDGLWEIAEGAMEPIPAVFDRRVPVPGLADLAKPPFVEAGTPQSGRHRRAFWYRRSFLLEGPTPASVRLKIHKAMYGTRVFLNGKLVGDHLPCFTPVEFDVRELLAPSGQPNQLVIRVGAHRDVLPKGMPDGFDFEKFDYIPGIYDSVELILSGLPRIANVQAVPNVAAKAVRVVAWIEGTPPADARLTCRVREAATGREAAAAEAPCPIQAGLQAIVLRLPIRNCQLWSPENPFLYQLEVSTGADTFRTRFGMRDFRLDPKTGFAVLNGKTYFLRGTNVCIFRFFEDPKRQDLPWREEWARKVHRTFKSMHWNSIRYCIGFPPEMWYRIADEEGLLIQDEFPIWYGGSWPKELTSEELVREYSEWMRERWNHPCVAIWDAQNETFTAETGKAIRAVQGLDLSGRPWDNGWSPPQSPGDCYEAHPYVFGSSAFRISDFASLSGAVGVPGGVPGAIPNAGKNPVIINEYSWGHMDRNGQPTIPMMEKFYETFLGPKTTVAERQEFHARVMAAETEFWRAKRQVAGVLHFCGLAYSKPKAVTSDHFADIETLALEPFFAKYVRDAFAPVGLMIDFWGDCMPAGRKCQVPVVVINDLDSEWRGSVRLAIVRDNKTATEQEKACRVAGLATRTMSFEVTVPCEMGRYRLVAQLRRPGQPPVESLRDFAVFPETLGGEGAGSENLARGKPVTASSSVTVDGTTYAAAYAVDGNIWTRWSSEFSDSQWIAVDLGRWTRVSRVELVWEAAYGKSYAIQVSADGRVWKTVHQTDAGQGDIETIRFAPVEARWVRMLGSKRGSPTGGYSLYEFKVFR